MKLTDKQKHGSDLVPAKYPDWFEIINPVLSDTNQTMDNILSVITENDCDDDDDEAASEYEETLSDLALAAQSYSSSEVVPETKVVPDAEIQTNVRDSDIMPETQIVSEAQEETRNTPVQKLSQNPMRKEL